MLINTVQRFGPQPSGKGIHGRINKMSKHQLAESASRPVMPNVFSLNNKVGFGAFVMPSLFLAAAHLSSFHGI